MTDSDSAGCEHCLGSFEMRDARQLLAALEYVNLPFEIEDADGIAQAGQYGSAGQMTRMTVWVRPQDQEMAERVMNAVLKITT